MERAFVYGDLLFETIRVEKGAAVLLHAHYNRMVSSAALLLMENLPSFGQFSEAIANAIAQSGLTDARVRFVLYRKSGGYYLPTGNQTAWDIEIGEIKPAKSSVSLGLYTDNYKPCNELSTLKTGNALIYVLASVWAKQNGYDDALLLNEHGCVCEATSSNVFVVKGELVFTPPISEGCVNGVMREFVINRLRESDYSISEKVITIEDIETADALFLTNAISGVKNVSQFERITYQKGSTVLGLL